MNRSTRRLRARLPLTAKGALAGRRAMLAVAAGLVVVLAADPTLLGSMAGLSAAAAEPSVIRENRGQNLAVAEAALQPGEAKESEELVAFAADADVPLDPIALPTGLPGEDEEIVEFGGGLLRSAGPAEPVPVDLDGMAVTVAPSPDAVTPARVRVAVTDQAAAVEAGITGVLLEVTDASDEPVPGEQAVELSVSYAGFAGIGGGDWASRVQTVWFPDCAADDPADPVCQPVPVDASIDHVAQTVTVTVPITPSDDVPGGGEEGGGSAPAMLRVAQTGGASGGRLGVTAGVAGPLGNWSATGLSPTSTWGTSGATGAFTWGYPMRVPAVPAGPVPELALSYSSAVSDGRVPSANTQAGVIGEGFDLSTSFVERTYVPCAQDEAGAANNAGAPAGDLCWGDDNATLSFNGASTELVRDGSTDRWRPKHDDGTRIERVSEGGAAGEYWKVTTTDGVEYLFGHSSAANSAWSVPVYGNHEDEPGHASAFSDSDRPQVWRWNLDYVVDASGNTASYFYETETNRYKPVYESEPVAYVSGGKLIRIEYGQHESDGVDVAPAKVELTHLPRCITNLAVPTSWCGSTQTSTTANHWPDTPVDLICPAGGACTTPTPTFFNRSRLAKVTTFAGDGSGYQPVDSWTLAQSFVPQGTGIGLEYASGIMLRLESVQHVAHGGALDDVDTLPPVRFEYQDLPNRVATSVNADALIRHRVDVVRTEAGGVISVAYRAPECSQTNVPTDPASNPMLCFPVTWNQGGYRLTEFFHKYVVETVTEGHTQRAPQSDELVTLSDAVVTSYEYGGGAKWAKPSNSMIPAADKTYSEFRGFERVTTRAGQVGSQDTKTVTTYYRGAGNALAAGPDGALSVTDSDDRFVGQVFSIASYDGDRKVSETATAFGAPRTMATDARGVKASRLTTQAAHAFAYTAAGSLASHTRSITTFDDHGQPTEVDDRGDVSTDDDDVCLTTRYAHVDDDTLTAKHLVALPALVESTAKHCGAPVERPTDVISASKATYDGQGRATRTEVLDPGDGDGFVLSGTAVYDARGRVTETADAAGQVTRTEYQASPGGLLAGTVITNPLGHVTKTEFDPVLGVPTIATDANGKKTTATYDAVGRLSTVVFPQHRGMSLPSVEYDYTVNGNGLNAVVTKTLSADGKKQHASAVLYDAMLRPFQTQTEARSGGADQGRQVAQTIYDSAGRVVEQTEPWWVEGDVSTVPERKPADTSGHTTFEYDLAGRLTAKVFWVGTDSEPSNEQWRTVTRYDGVTTLQIPPAGAPITATTVDARGRTSELTQYARVEGANGAGEPGAKLTTTSYRYDPAGRLIGMTDTRQNEWSYDYDWAGRQIAASDPDSGESSTTYDLLGRVLTRTDGNGHTLGYTYDALGRTTSVRDGSPTGAVRASWQYDTVLKGVLTSSTRVVDGQSYVTRASGWDEAYRPTKSTVELPDTGAFATLQSRSLTTEYGYTVDGQVENVTYPAVVKADGTVVLRKERVTTTYDASSSMPSWMGGGFGWGVYVAYSRYDPDGRPLLTDLGSTYGTAVSYRYQEGTKRLAGISLDRERINGTELDLSYDYDQAGNVTSLKDAPTNPALDAERHRDHQCFGYDDLTRLDLAWTASDGDCKQAPTVNAMGGAAPYWTQYEYDVLGNRVAQTTHNTVGTPTTTTFTHGQGGAGPHAVTSATTGGTATTFEYDDAGNRVSKQIGDAAPTTYQWDAEGELTTAGDVSNVYDAHGNRLVRTDPTGTTVYVGGQEVFISGADVSVNRYYTFGGRTVAVRTGRGVGDAVSSLVNDAHGTPVAAVLNGGNPATTPVRRLYTDPFGATRGPSGPSTVAGDTQFLGKTRDEATGLTLLGARYFDEQVGGFISVDPVLDLTDPQQWNAYAYANSNPVTLSDPSGLLALGGTDYTDVNGKNFRPAANGTVQASPPKTVDPPVSPDFWTDPGGWIEYNQAEIVGAVGGAIVGGLVTAGCLAVTAGAGSVGCLVLGGAAGGAFGGAVTNLWKTQVTRTQQFSWGGLLADTAIGGLFGAAGGVAGAGVSAVASRVAASAASPAVRAAANVASCAVNSFVPGTAVVLADGTTRAIEDIQLGDEVLATDPETGGTGPQPVTRVITGDGEKDLTTITIADAGTDADAGTGQAATVVATDGHPFWVPEPGRWVEAGDLLPGDWLRTAAGTRVQVTAIQHDHRQQAVHNLTVANTHTYYVVAGTDAVLTHNCNLGGAGNTVPTVTFSRSSAPGIAQTFDDAVAAGAPTRLTRVDAATRDANRRAALRGQSPAPAGQSLDEYPFACSAQGGCGATVRSVPAREQSYQGGVLSRFFQNNGLRPGDPFDVRFE